MAMTTHTLNEEAEARREKLMRTDEEIEAYVPPFEYDRKNAKHRKFWDILRQIEAEQAIRKPESPLVGEIII